MMNQTPAAIAKEYRALLAWVRSQPESAQWQYGDQLRAMQVRYKVETEAREVRG